MIAVSPSTILNEQMRYFIVLFICFSKNKFHANILRKRFVICDILKILFKERARETFW